MDRLRDWALKLIIALNLIALTVSFAESFSGLYQWALHHSVTSWQTAIWPLMIDVIVLAGEAGLFVAHKDHWRVRDKVWLWFVTLTALAVSMAANIGHVESSDWLSHLTAALPPVALFFTMTVGFGVMKRVYLNKPQARSETLSPHLPESLSQPLTQFVRTSQEGSHTGSQPWVERPPETLSRSPAEGLTSAETVRAETLSPPLTERPAPALPESLNPTETFAAPDFKVIPGKSFTLPQDTRQGLKMAEVRVRDMLDVDPDISANAISKALGCAWATADKYLNATKEARGLAVS